MSAEPQHGRPWWASGDDAPSDEDPLTTHRRARAGHGEPGSDPDRSGHASGEAGPAGHADDAPHRWWSEAAEVLSRVAREAGRATAAAGDAGTGEDGAEHVHTGSGEACRVCPLCAGLRALGDARPELLGHLSEAARHLALAVRAVVDAAPAAGSTDDGLQRIDLDEE